MMLSNIIIKNLLHQESDNVILIPIYSKLAITEAVVSLLNTRNGDILVGIDDEKKVVGLPNAEQKVKEIMSFLQEQVVPNAPFTLSVCNYNKKDILLISVWEGAQKPYSYNKKIYVRVGNSAVVATAAKIPKIISFSFSCLSANVVLCV